jgi:hypothetical protein
MGREPGAPGQDQREHLPELRGLHTLLRLRKSDVARRVWQAYHERTKLAPRSTPPKTAQKSYWARGLALSDPSARPRTVRRYDRTEPRKGDLSPENAAMLMKVNQQNTLVDMWR